MATTKVPSRYNVCIRSRKGSDKNSVADIRKDNEKSRRLDKKPTAILRNDDG